MHWQDNNTGQYDIIKNGSDEK